jgi:hypothetical protein
VRTRTVRTGRRRGTRRAGAGRHPRESHRPTAQRTVVHQTACSTTCTLQRTAEVVKNTSTRRTPVTTPAQSAQRTAHRVQQATCAVQTSAAHARSCRGRPTRRACRRQRSPRPTPRPAQHRSTSAARLTHASKPVTVASARMRMRGPIQLCANNGLERGRGRRTRPVLRVLGVLKRLSAGAPHGPAGHAEHSRAGSPTHGWTCRGCWRRHACRRRISPHRSRSPVRIKCIGLRALKRAECAPHAASRSRCARSRRRRIGT